MVSGKDVRAAKYRLVWPAGTGDSLPENHTSLSIIIQGKTDRACGRPIVSSMKALKKIFF
jgi:hypothetical protein